MGATTMSGDDVVAEDAPSAAPTRRELRLARERALLGDGAATSEGGVATSEGGVTTSSTTLGPATDDPAPKGAPSDPTSDVPSDSTSNPSNDDAASPQPADPGLTGPTRIGPPEAVVVGTPAEPTPPRTSRAGRNLPMATAVGLGLLAAVLLTLFVRKELFGLLAGAAGVLALIELRAALARVRIQVPLLPIAVGMVGMFVSAYLVGAEALVVALVITAGAVVVWCVLDAPGVRAMRNASAAIFVVAYVPFLASFLALALAESDGAWRVLFIILVAMCCDVGGYAAGVFLGRHPIAPTVSPKKSWEGLGGSVVLAGVVGAAVTPWFFGAPWWVGGVVGVVGVAAALVGDLAESLLKRDLGVKDMGDLLPGHGGVLDRIDSILVVAPVGAVLLDLMLRTV